MNVLPKLSVTKLISVLLCLALFFPTAVFADPQIYLSAERLWRLNAGESELEQLTETFATPNYPGIDSVNKKFYWGVTGRLFRCSFDGSDFETVFDAEDGLGSVTGISVDPVGGYVYWTDNGNSRIWRGKIDGSGTPEVLYTGASGPVGIGVDATAGKLYWGQQGNARIMTANMSGLGPKSQVVAITNTITGLALDLTNNKIYWSDFGNNSIERSDLDGMNKEILFDNMDGVNAPGGLSVDVANGLLYVTDAGGKVFRGKTDGSGSLTELFDITGTNGNAQGVSVTPDGTEVIFPGDKSIFKGASDGTGDASKILDLDNSFEGTRDIALDLTNSRIFVFDASVFNAQIASIPLEFTPASEGAKRLFSGTITTLFDSTTDSIGAVEGLVYDAANDRLIFINGDKIQRGSADGSGSLEDLFDAGDGLIQPASLRHDPDGGKLYWAEPFNNSIHSGNVDGSGMPATLFDVGDGLAGPQTIAIDPSGGFIYWGDTGLAQILRGNIDGSGMPVTLFDNVDGVSSPQDLRLDLENGYLYFTDQTARALIRGSIDGSGLLEKVVKVKAGYERVQIVQDDDNDGTPNGVDGCGDDSAKIAPGDCGCGNTDSDDNENGISDCLLNPDIKEQITAVRELVSSLKSTRTRSPKKNKKRRKAQRETLDMIAADIGVVNSTMTANLAMYSLVDPSIDLADRLDDAVKKSLRARKTGSRRFNKFKKQALKALDALNSALSAS